MSIVVPRAAEPTTAPVAPVEAAPETPQVETKVADEQLSPKFAALARQQKEIRKQQLEFKAEREAWLAEKAAKDIEYSTKYVAKDRLKSNPYDVLTENEVPYDQIVNGIMSQDPQAIANRKLEQRIAQMEAAQKKAEEDAASNQTKQYEQAVEQVRNKVKLLVDSDPIYETIKANDAQEAVVDLIKKTFEEENKLLTEEEAATQVEEYLLEQAVKLARLEKVQKRLSPEVAAPEAVAPKSHIKTLTNTATNGQAKPMSPKERRERAIAAFQGRLQP